MVVSVFIVFVKYKEFDIMELFEIVILV